MQALYVSLCLNKAVESIAITCFSENKEECERISRQQILDDPLLVLNLTQPTALIIKELSVWLLVNEVDELLIPMLIQKIGKVLLDTLSEIEKKNNEPESSQIDNR